MRSRNLAWIERVDLGASDALKESRSHLDFLRRQLRASSIMIEGARACINESLERLAGLDEHGRATDRD